MKTSDEFDQLYLSDLVSKCIAEEGRGNKKLTVCSSYIWTGIHVLPSLGNADTHRFVIWQIQTESFTSR